MPNLEEWEERVGKEGVEPGKVPRRGTPLSENIISPTTGVAVDCVKHQEPPHVSHPSTVNLSTEYVYVISSDCGLVKIGWALNPEARRADLQKKSVGRKLTLVYTEAIHGTHGGFIEAQAHKQLKAQCAEDLARKNGLSCCTEWFTIDVYTAIDAVKAAHTQCPFERNSLNIVLAPVMTPTAWQLPPTLSEGEWEACGEKLKRMESGHQWWLGDWWLIGKKQKWWCYGEGKGVAEALGINYASITTYASVCRAFEPSRRLGNLSFSHHQEVCSLPKSAQDKMLDQAQDNKLSSSKLRASISKTKAIAKTKITAFEMIEKKGQYTVLYADPPWRFESPAITSPSRLIEKEYPTMSLEELLALPVKEVAAPDSILYLWSTNAHLYTAMCVMQSWGFEYKANMVWNKDKWGMGYYCRNQHELLLIGKRGRPALPSQCSQIPSVIDAPTAEHSRKPIEFIEIIDKCWPGIRKLELFARQDGKAIRHEWSVWGNQAQSTDDFADPISERHS